MTAFAIISAVKTVSEYGIPGCTEAMHRGRCLGRKPLVLYLRLSLPVNDHRASNAHRFLGLRMDENKNEMPPSAMVEIALADIRRGGESGLALLHKLAQVDELLTDDPSARVLLLVCSKALPAEAQRTCPSEENPALTELATAGHCPQPSLEQVLWEHARQTVDSHRGNCKAAAKTLHISDKTLRRRLEHPPAA